MNTYAQSPNRGREQSEPMTCWECQSLVQIGDLSEGPFCHECGKVQPIPTEKDYFSFLGFPRRLVLADSEVEEAYRKLSWKLHPDRFHTAGDYEQELSLELTSVLNDAYRTLRNPVSRIEYLLRLRGVRREGELRQQAPPELLEEIFELNEHLEEIRDARGSDTDAGKLQSLRGQLESARESFTAKLDAVLADLAKESGRWDELAAAGQQESGEAQEVCGRLNDVLNRHQYIRNLVERVTEELEA